MYHSIVFSGWFVEIFVQALPSDYRLFTWDVLFFFLLPFGTRGDSTCREPHFLATMGEHFWLEPCLVDQ